MEGEYILHENLILALEQAIAAREEFEKDRLAYSNGSSALLAGWKANLEALKKKKLKIKYQ